MIGIDLGDVLVYLSTVDGIIIMSILFLVGYMGYFMGTCIGNCVVFGGDFDGDGTVDLV